jgi:hypothetical protein
MVHANRVAHGIGLWQIDLASGGDATALATTFNIRGK